MFPLIRFVALFGGVAAGAQVASGLVRGVKEVCRGRPVAGLMEVADGLAAPILTAVNEVSKCGKEIYDAVTSPWIEESKVDLNEQVTAQPPKHRCLHAEEAASVNGVSVVAAKG